jgi:hypothetical protein
VSDDLTTIEQQLRDRGISAYRQQPNQLVLSRQSGPVRPGRGNSFWICKLTGHWYVCTWAPLYYRVPAESSLVDACEAFLDVGETAQSRVPAELLSRFALTETDADNFDRLWEASQSGWVGAAA